jgi:hypothetical protein
MDARQMTYANESFDGIIDKAMLDSMLVRVFYNLVWIKRSLERI